MSVGDPSPILGTGAPAGPVGGTGAPADARQHGRQRPATVEPVDVLEVAGGPRLELPAEPLDLKVALRAAVLGIGEQPDRQASAIDESCLGVWLWSRWQPALEPRGCTREQFVDTVVDLRREVVLWLLGDRPWLQVVSSLAGRISRRLPSSEDSTG